MNFERDDFVHWTGTDQDGNFSHVGQVMSCSDENLEFATPHGVITVTIDDGNFRHISRPQGWSTELPKATKKPVKTSHTKPDTKTTTTISVKSGSKKEKALDIYKQMMDNNTHPIRSEVIQVFMNDLDMTKAGASTYHSMAKKLM